MNSNSKVLQLRLLFTLIICIQFSVAGSKASSYLETYQPYTSQELILTVTPTNHNVGFESGTAVFNVTSNTSWEATDDADWLTISPASGSGNGTVTVTYASNNQPIQRIGSITVSGTGVSSQKVTVAQEPYYTLSVTPDIIMFEACFHSPQQISVKSNTSWTLSFDPNIWWLTVSPMSGVGDGVITLNVIDNIEVDTRQAILNFTLPDGKVIIATIMQGGGTWIFVEPYSRDVSFEEGSTKFMVTAISNGWTHFCPFIFEDLDWITVEPESFCDGAEVVVHYSENKIAQGRTGQICFISPCGVSMCVTVTQDGAPTLLEISPGEIQLNYQEGSKSDLNVLSTIEWSAITSETWLILNPSSGIGDGKITATALINASITSRIANITLSGPGVENKEVKVTQAGAPPFLETSVSSLPLSSAEGASGTFDISSNTNWTAVSSESWLTISSAGAFGNATITVSAQKNPTINTRNATVTIKANDLNDKTVIISQVGSPTGIDEFNNSPITIYPNPAKNILTIEGLFKDYQLYIYDQNGKQMINSKLRRSHIDITSLTPGIYTLILMDGKERNTFKFIKD